MYEYFTVANAVRGMSMLAEEVFGHRLQQVGVAIGCRVNQLRFQATSSPIHLVTPE